MPDDKGARPVVHTKKHLARLERERRQTRMILFSFIALLVIAIGAVVYGWLDITYFQLQKPVAKVGDVNITVRDFQMRVKVYRVQLLNAYQQYSLYQQYGLDMSQQLSQMDAQLQDTETLGKSVLDQMIDEELVRQEAAKRGITVTDQELEDRIQAFEDYYPAGSPTPTITPTDITVPTDPPDVLKYVTATSAFTATLEFTTTPEVTFTPETALTGTAAPETTGTPGPSATPTLEATATPTETAAPTVTFTPTLSGSPTPEPTSTPYTEELYKENLNQFFASYAKYGLTNESFREMMRVQLLREKLYDQVTKDLPPSEEQLWVRHILVENEVDAVSIIESLKKGADFGEVASKKSIDPGSASKGGDLGWMGHHTMVEPFTDAAYALKVGEISQPVKTQYGYHVIQVIAREVRPLDAQAYQSFKDAAFDDFLKQLKEEYGVVTYDETWKPVVPTEPSIASIATEGALTQQAPR